MISQCFTPYFHTPPVSVRGAWPLWMRVPSQTRVYDAAGDVMEAHEHNGRFQRVGRSELANMPPFPAHFPLWKQK
jgi:hypothetical protein